MSARAEGTDQRPCRYLAGHVNVVGQRGKAPVNTGRGLRDHPGDSHGIANNVDELSGGSGYFRERQDRKPTEGLGILCSEDSEVGTRRNGWMRQPDWSGPTGEKDHESFNDGGGAAPDQFFGL